MNKIFCSFISILFLFTSNGCSNQGISSLEQIEQREPLTETVANESDRNSEQTEKDSDDHKLIDEFAKQDALKAQESIEDDSNTIDVIDDEQIFERGEIAYLEVDVPEDLVRTTNNAFYLYGSTSDNCSKIVVKAVNKEAGIEDLYPLKDYTYGDTSFKYGIREDWKNLGNGLNKYYFFALCDYDQKPTYIAELTFQQTNTYKAPYIPPVYPTYPSNKAFYNYTCTENCEGHEAGYEWAEENDISDYDDCGGNSNSFIEGCYAYVDEYYGDVSLQYNPFEDKYEYATDKESLQYNPYDDKWEYATDKESLRYNPYEDKYEYATDNESLRYDPLSETWSYE